MAIPFNVPSEEQADDRHVIRIPICEIIRQIVPPESTNYQGSQSETARHDGPLVFDGPIVFTLSPDIVVRAGSARKPVPLRRRRRRQEKLPQDEPQPTLNLGIELRHVEEHFTQSMGQIKKRETKSSSFFSLLIPTQIPNSIWTTVIILVGWRIFTRQR